MDRGSAALIDVGSGTSVSSKVKGSMRLVAAMLTLLTVAAPVAHAHGALPDGRAYEQASAAEKGGAAASGNLGVVQAASGGGGIAWFSLSTLPGSEGAGTYGTYLSARGTENWTTRGLLPPASLGREGSVKGWSEDLRFSYVLSKVPGTGLEFYRRENATQTFSLISHLPGEFGQGSIKPVGTSADGARMLFEARKQLVVGASEEDNLYLWDSETGEISLASAMNNGEAPIEGAFAGPYQWPAGELFGGGTAGEMYTSGVMSEDGTSAYFTSAGSGALYLRRNISKPQSQLSSEGDCLELANACTVWISKSQASLPDLNGEKPAAFLAASTSGPSVVFFASSEKLTDDATTGPADEGLDLYRYDVNLGTLTDVTPDLIDPNGAEVRGLLGIDVTGSRAFFAANGVLGDGAAKGALRGDCTLPPGIGHETVSGRCNLYFWERGQGIQFLARLNADGAAIAPLQSSVSDAVDWMPGPSLVVEPTARVSEDGNTLVFRSREQLTNYENHGVPEFYRYQVDSKTLSCLTCTTNGAAPSFVPSLFSIEAFGSTNGTPILTRNLSADGTRFIFETGEALVPADTNGVGGCPLALQPFSSVPKCQDVYEWEAEGAGSCITGNGSGGCVYLLSSGTSPNPSFFADADLTADNVFFYTSDQLVNQDRDQLVDIYDARVGGGLSAQTQPPPEPCVNEVGCRGPVGVASSRGQSADSAVATATNQTKKLRCEKGLRKVKRHGKQVCVKRQKHSRKTKHHKAGRQANSPKAGHSGSKGGGK